MTAGDLLLRHLRAQPAADARESLRRQAHLVGLDRGQALRLQHGGQRDQQA
jgi:hypothetical protein